MGGVAPPLCGGCDTPLKTSCRQMKGFVSKRKIIYHKTLSYIRFTVGPLKWYTDRNFFGDGGGGRSSKIFFCTKGTNNLQVFNHLNLAALHYGHPLTTWFVGKFYTHTPLFKPPRYGPASQRGSTLLCILI